jgi:hypothetical protein
MILRSANALILARLLEQIPNVAQVRFHYVLHKNIPFSQDAILYKVFIKSLDQSNPIMPGEFAYINISTIVDTDVYENLEKHAGIQYMMNEKVGHYYKNGVVPDIAPAFEPVGVDEDGNQIPYDLTRNNPVR